MSLLLYFCLLIASPGEPVRRLPPVDNCSVDSSFAKFRTELIDAVARRDTTRLLEAIGENIEFDFDGGVGRERFVANWRLPGRSDSPLWEELGKALSLGCSRGADGTYWSPSLAASDGIDDLFTTLLVIRPGASLHASATVSSPVLARLDWDLVESVDRPEGNPWWKVRMTDGREGFVRRSNLRSPIDYRAGFERIDGRWQMTVFIAGD